MNYTTTLTTKNQLTVPKVVRDKLNLQVGTKIDIYPTFNGEFIGRPRRKSNIMKFAGDLAHLDDGKSWKDIREEAEKLMVADWIKTKDKNDKNNSR